MNGKCARCQKTVYQVEELKCLDKVWHKSCFRCTVCGMALTLKNYKGYNRMPYCNAHAPKAQATTVASTPEMKRLTNNTRLQSNVKYHEEYEREKKIQNQGKNDETTSAQSKQSTKLDSNVAYRVCKIEHKNIVEQRKRELDNISRQSSSNRSALNSPKSTKVPPHGVNLYDGKTRRNLFISNSGISKTTNNTNMSNSSTEEVKLSYKSTTFNENLSNSSNSFSSMDSIQTVTNDTKKPQKRLIAGNGPHTGFEELYSRQKSNKENHFSSTTKESTIKSDRSVSKLSANISNITLTTKNSKTLLQSPPKHEIEEKLEKVIKCNLPESNSKTNTKVLETSKVEPQEPSTSIVNSNSTTVVKEVLPVKSFGIRIYRALFDFHAKEDDEASFQEDDTIIEVEKENYGWITGRVERTGKIGLIPANYLERYKSESQMKLEKKLSQVQTKNINNHIQEKQSNESDEEVTTGVREVLIK